MNRPGKYFPFVQRYGPKQREREAILEIPASSPAKKVWKENSKRISALDRDRLPGCVFQLNVPLPNKHQIQNFN